MKETSNKICEKSKTGYVMIIVLIMMMVLVAASYLYADALFSELIIARNNKGAQAAFSLADAGVQEAIYRVQYDPTANNTFRYTETGQTTFNHNPALINNGSYSVTIQNISFGTATITSVGLFQMGLRTARREIRVSIAQATSPPPYDDDAALFSHSAGGQSTGDFEFDDATIIVYGGSIASGRDISLDDTTMTIEKGVRYDRNLVSDDSTVNCNCLIEDDGDPLTTQCGDNPGCAFQSQPAGQMPEVDFDSSSLNSYKQRAVSLGQYYDSQNDFFTETGFSAGTTKTFSGVIYIEGSLDLDSNRTLIMNGVVAGSGTITIGKNSGPQANGTLTINNPGPGQASGVLTLHDFIINRNGNFSGTGLIYSGIKVDIQNSNNNVELTGGILSRRILVNERTLIVHFDQAIINQTLDNPSETPVIEINHWEEEY